MELRDGADWVVRCTAVLVDGVTTQKGCPRKTWSGDVVVDMKGSGLS